MTLNCRTFLNLVIRKRRGRGGEREGGGREGGEGRGREGRGRGEGREGGIIVEGRRWRV